MSEMFTWIFVLYLSIFMFPEQRVSGTTVEHSEIQFIGLYLKKEVVFIDLSTDSDTSKSRTVTFDYWWKDNEAHSNPTQKFTQVFDVTSVIHFVPLNTSIENSFFFCLQIHEKPSSKKCLPYGDQTHLELPPPANVHVASVNHNFSLLWTYDYGLLANEVSFTVQIDKEIDHDDPVWTEAIGCEVLHDNHCDLFRNYFYDDEEDYDCPEKDEEGEVKGRVRACTNVRTDACGEYIHAKKFNVEMQDIISPPEFTIFGLVSSNQLRIDNYPHVVPFSNKSLSCYYLDSLKYQIRYYYEKNERLQSVEDELLDSFSVESITFDLRPAPTNNTVVCVKMRIKYKIGNGGSEWRTQCKTLVINEDIGTHGNFKIQVALTALAVVVFLLLLILSGYKAKKFYKSTFGQKIEIPSELAKVKKEIEENDFNRSTQHVLFVQSLENDEQKNFSWESIDSWDPDSVVKKPEKMIADMISACKEAERVPLCTPERALCENASESSASDDVESMPYVRQTQNGKFVFEDVDLRPSEADVSTSPRSFGVKAPNICSKPCQNNLELINANNQNGTLVDTKLQSMEKPLQFKHAFETLPRAGLKLSPVQRFPQSRHDMFSSNDVNQARFKFMPHESRVEGVVKLANPTYSVPCNSDETSMSQTSNQLTPTKCAHIDETLNVGKDSEYNANQEENVHQSESSNRKNMYNGRKINAQKFGLRKHLECGTQATCSSLAPNALVSSPDVHSKKVYIPGLSGSNIPLLPFYGNSFGSALIDSCDDPGYVTYERSRTDSYRSGDSGLPYDWSYYSDDSTSPPQSPNDLFVTQQKHSSYLRRSFFTAAWTPKTSAKLRNNDNQIFLASEHDSTSKYEAPTNELNVPKEEDYVSVPTNRITSNYVKLSAFTFSADTTQE